MFRVGLGQDSHQFELKDKKTLILGGIKVSENGGLKANSDGDVIIHSLCNALSSAIGGDSLGNWADDMCLEKGIKDSSQYLDVILKKVGGLGFTVVNISISVEAKTPRLTSETISIIKGNLSLLLNVDISQVGITFTSGNGLTSFGKGDGMQVMTIVLLKK